MGWIRVEARGIVAAPAGEVYDVLADYRDGHPHILPPENFRDMVVEAGGHGAGTVIRFLAVAGGRPRCFRMRVSEPDPGRVLVERDVDSDLTTTFTVTPGGDGRSIVHIVTEWEARPGVAGVFERLAARPTMRGIYAKELRRLGEFLARRPRH